MDPAFLSHEFIASDPADTLRIRTSRDEVDALQLLRDQDFQVAVIVADHRMLRRLEPDLSNADRARHHRMVRVLITDGSEPHADFAAINQAPVFRVLEKSMDAALIRHHLREALSLHARQTLESQRLEDGGPALRDALAFLAHEINTPLSLVQGYARALIERAGVFSSMPVQPDTVLQALKATERSARRCLTLTAFMAETAESAFSFRAQTTCTASALLVRLLSTYSFAGNERDWLTVHVEQDFQLECRPELLQLVLFTLMHNALHALHGTALPRLRITVDAQDNTNRIRFAYNGKRLPAEALHPLINRPSDSGSQGTDLLFCQRVMRSLRGDFLMESALAKETVALLRFEPAAAPSLPPIRSTGTCKSQEAKKRA